MKKVRLVALWDYIMQLRDFLWTAFDYKITERGEAEMVTPVPREDVDGK